jgi:hypothetical protein
MTTNNVVIHGAPRINDRFGVDHALMQRHVKHRPAESGERSGHVTANRRIYDFTIDRKYARRFTVRRGLDHAQALRGRDGAARQSHPQPDRAGSRRTKTVAFKVPKPTTQDEWVRSAPAPEQTTPSAPAQPTKRFTLDVPLDLHGRIKVACAKRGLKMADVLRDLLEREFPADVKA